MPGLGAGLFNVRKQDFPVLQKVDIERSVFPKAAIQSEDQSANNR